MPKITIEAPKEGIARSAHIGFEDIRNLDIDTIPGVVKMNNILVKRTGTTITQVVNWITQDKTSLYGQTYYSIGTNSRVYESSDNGGTWSLMPGSPVVSGQGIIVWKNFLIVAGAATLYTWGPLTTALTVTITEANPGVFSDVTHGLQNGDRVVLYTTDTLPTNLTTGVAYYVVNRAADTFQLSLTSGGSAIDTSGAVQAGTHSYRAWQTFQTIDTDSKWHPMWVSKNDGNLYGGAGRYVFSISETSGDTFDPGEADGTSYDFIAQALDLPADYRIKCLTELGNNLMAGTWMADQNTGEIYSIRIADIFPWDRSSVSFGQPIVMEEYGIHGLLNDGNSLVVLAGIDGRIFRCDGANTYPIGQVPQDLSNNKYIEFYPGALCKFKNKIFFGVSNGGTTAMKGMGIYSIKETSKGNILNYEHIISTLTDGSLFSLKVTALTPVNRDTLLAGWEYNSTYGIDKITNTSYAYGTDYSAYFDSPIYEIGNVKNKWKPISIELHLGKPLATGEGIKILYRTSLSGTFTEVKTIAYADNDVGAMISKIFTTENPFTIKEGEQLQIRVALKGTSTTSPEFKFLILQ